MTEPTANWLKINGTDLTPYTSSVDFTHTADEAANKAAWGEYLAGLETSTMSLTFDNSAGAFTPFGELHFPPTQRVRTTIAQPDGWWQRAKQRLKSWPGLGWIKVRYREYTFDAEFDTWQPTEDGYEIQGRSVGPITKGLEER